LKLRTIVRKALKMSKDPRVGLAQRLDPYSKHRIFAIVYELKTVKEIMAYVKYLNEVWNNRGFLQELLEQNITIVNKSMKGREKSIESGVKLGEELYEKYGRRIYDGLYALVKFEEER